MSDLRINRDKLPEYLRDGAESETNLEDAQVLRAAADEIERLRAELLTCSRLASGEHHPIPGDRCAAICCHVDHVLNAAKAAGGGG
jgi:hypothetical protein